MVERIVEKFPVEAVHVGARLRGLDPAKVASMAESIAAVGLMQPITVRWGEAEEGGVMVETGILIAGNHRLAAVKALGWTEIDVFVVAADDTESRLAEIAENLHRSELTVQERANHVAEWVRLTDEKLRQVDAVSPTPGGRGHQGGTRAAARDLGMTEASARRSVKIASITEDAKEAARAAGLDDNQTALLKVAKAPPEQQAQKVAEIVEQKARKAVSPSHPDDALDDFEVTEKQVNTLVAAWNKAGPEARERFREYIDRAVFDATSAGGQRL